MSESANIKFLDQPIFIVASRRSGSTLLKTILNRHSSLHTHPDEPQFILELYERFGFQLPDVSVAAAFLAHHPYRADTVSTSDIEMAFNPYEKLDLAEFTHIYLQLWAKNTNQRPVLKHPRFIFHLAILQAIFAKVTVIHILRDPRGNVASQMARWPNLTVWEGAMFWKTAVNAARHWGHSHPNQYVEVLYEDLLKQPDKTIQDLCQQLNLDYEPQMLTFQEETRFFSPDLQPESVVLTAVDRSRLTLWQDRLTPMEIKLIESCCNQEMVLWHYPLLNPNISIFSYSARYSSERLFYFLKNIIRNLKRLPQKISWRFNRKPAKQGL